MTDANNPILPAPAGEIYTDDGPVDWEKLCDAFDMSPRQLAAHMGLSRRQTPVWVTTYDPRMTLWRHDRESNQRFPWGRE